jgi:hypothetical protein
MKQFQLNHHFDHQLFSQKVFLIAILLLGPDFLAFSQKATDVLSGDWRAVVLNKAGEEIAFKLEIKRDGGQVSGALVNGEQRVESTGGSFDGQTLKLRYDFYDGELTATLVNPTTIFIGRDGRVKRIHAGFEGPAAGVRHTQLKADLDELVQELLESDRAGN